MSFVASCQLSKTESIESKNRCFSEQPSKLKNTYRYREVRDQFIDTFELLRRDQGYFGKAERVETRLDSAAFFSADSAKCILLVLTKLKDSASMPGGAVVILEKVTGSDWRFEIESSLSFDYDYFKEFKVKDFETMSKLSGYAILAVGSVRREGCEIDEGYWFRSVE